jgi:predicted GTPase
MDTSVIRCEICFEKFHPNIEGKKPRVLPCGHTFCTNCLTKLALTKLICPLDRKEFEIDNVALLPINFQLLKILDSFCATCENKVTENSYLCQHCHKRICNECKSKHFEEYKASTKLTLDNLSRQIKLYESNASDLKTFLNTDLQSTRTYIDRTIPKMKGQEKNGIAQKVVKFYTDHEAILEKIKKEHEIIKEKVNQLADITTQFEQTSFEIGADEARNESIKKLEQLNEAISIIDQYKPCEITQEISIIDSKYNVSNPIIENRQNWIQHELELANFNEKYDPAKLFSSLKNDLLGKGSKIQISLGVVGRAGTGKSSFVNAFFNLKPDDVNYIKTDFVECTFAARMYNLENNTLENVIIWDTPGVGTPTFKLEQHNRIIDQIKCDAFVYLYDTQFNEVDKNVIETIRNKKKNVFICRTKIDNDFKRNIEKEKKLPFRNIPQEQRDKYLNRERDEYKSLFVKLRSKYEEDRLVNNLFLRDEKVFYISNNSLFRERELFEFDEFQEKLMKSLPDIQANVVLSSIKTRSLKLVEQKRDVLLREIDVTVKSWMDVHEDLSQFKCWLSTMLQEYARHLGLNELFKNLDESEASETYDELLDKIESELPLKLDAIRSHGEDFKSSDKVELSLKNNLSFRFRNFGTRKILEKNISIFLRDNLNKLYKKTCDIFSGFYIHQYENIENLTA